MMQLLSTVLSILVLAAPSLAGLLEARQAFPVNGTCNGPTDTFGAAAFDMLVQTLYYDKNVTLAFSQFFDPGCACPPLPLPFPPLQLVD